MESAAETQGPLATAGAQEHFGELVQLYGSFHDWFEGPGPRGCLMNEIWWMMPRGEWGRRMGKEETIWAARVLQGWIEKYGTPRALYTDWKNVYKRQATTAEQLGGESASDAIWAHVSEASTSYS